MKAGKDIVALAKQIQSENATKRDFIASTNRLTYLADAPAETEEGKSALGAIRFEANDNEIVVTPTKHCIRQIGEHTGIPARYVERMATDGNRDLLANNINHWFKKEPSKRMLRTFINGTGVARAFLSDRYRPLDNAQLAEAVLPRLAESGCDVISSEITETRLYIQAATPKMELDINALMKKRGITHVHGGTRPDDPVQAGIVISNSEVGASAIRIEPMLYRLVCYNGLIMAQSIKRHHVGRSMFAELDDAAEYFTDRTRQMDDAAFWAKVRDVVNGVFDHGRFESLVEKFARSQAVSIGENIESSVEMVTERLKLDEGEKNSVLKHLIAGGDLSVFGMVNAVTRSAEDAESYDRAIELERAGSDILELPATEWAKLAA